MHMYTNQKQPKNNNHFPLFVSNDYFIFLSVLDKGQHRCLEWIYIRKDQSYREYINMDIKTKSMNITV